MKKNERSALTWLVTTIVIIAAGGWLLASREEPERHRDAAAAGQNAVPATNQDPSRPPLDHGLEVALHALVRKAVSVGEGQRPPRCPVAARVGIDDRLDAATQATSAEARELVSSLRLLQSARTPLESHVRERLSRAAHDECAPYSTLVVLQVCENAAHLCSRDLLRGLVEDPPAQSSVIMWLAYTILAGSATNDDIAFLSEDLHGAPPRVAMALRGLSKTREGARLARDYLMSSKSLDTTVSRNLTPVLRDARLTRDPELVRDLLRRDPEAVGATLDALATTQDDLDPGVLSDLGRLACAGEPAGDAAENLRSQALEALGVHVGSSRETDALVQLRDVAADQSCPSEARATALGYLARAGVEGVHEDAAQLITDATTVDPVVQAVEAYLASNADRHALDEALAGWVALHRAERCHLASILSRNGRQLALSHIFDGCEQL